MLFISEWPIGPASIRSLALRSSAAASCIHISSQQSAMSQAVHVRCRLWFTFVDEACLFRYSLATSFCNLELHLCALCTYAGPIIARLVHAQDEKAAISTPPSFSSSHAGILLELFKALGPLLPVPQPCWGRRTARVRMVALSAHYFFATAQCVPSSSPHTPFSIFKGKPLFMANLVAVALHLLPEVPLSLAGKLNSSPLLSALSAASAPATSLANQSSPVSLAALPHW